MAAGDSLLLLATVLVQVGYVFMNIISKLAMDSGMNPFIHVAYRQIFASVAITPFAYFLERKTRPKMTLPIFIQIFLSFNIRGNTKPDYLLCWVEKFHSNGGMCIDKFTPSSNFSYGRPFWVRKHRNQHQGRAGKLLGTAVCVGGAMLLSFYHGSVVPIGKSRIQWSCIAQNSAPANQSNHGNFMLGPFLLIASPISWAVWFIIQARMSNLYPAPYSSSALMCLMASFQCVIIGLGVDHPHDLSAWSLFPGVRAVSSIYAGIVCAALAYCIMSWCIERKGPLYVSVFSPLLLVVVAILSWALLQEQLYVGTIAGSILIVMGLYAVLWGKNKEMTNPKSAAKIDNVELDLPKLENGDFAFEKK